jgi:hypothetical protein
MKTAKMPGFSANTSLFQPEALLATTSAAYAQGTDWTGEMGRQAVIPQWCTPCIPFANRKFCCSWTGCRWRSC